MSEVCVTYIHRVFCIVNEETGGIDRVLSGEELELDTEHKEGYIHNLDSDSVEAISPDSERGRNAVKVAESDDWPAWSF
jgi:hypothetical protein